jgi:hypothetical protein
MGREIYYATKEGAVQTRLGDDDIKVILGISRL